MNTAVTKQSLSSKRQKNTLPALSLSAGKGVNPNFQFSIGAASEPCGSPPAPLKKAGYYSDAIKQSSKTIAVFSGFSRSFAVLPHKTRLLPDYGDFLFSFGSLGGGDSRHALGQSGVSDGDLAGSRRILLFPLLGGD